jgi:hypothetical protein
VLSCDLWCRENPQRQVLLEAPKKPPKEASSHSRRRGRGNFKKHSSTQICHPCPIKRAHLAKCISIVTNIENMEQIQKGRIDHIVIILA